MEIGTPETGVTPLGMPGKAMLGGTQAMSATAMIRGEQDPR